MHQPLPRHLPALDGLRGFAAIIVVISHCANPGLLPGFLGLGFGETGVAMFYVLSGFLMMHFAVGRVLNAHNLRRYAISRASRVLPLFYLALLVAMVIYWVTGFGFYYINEGHALVWNLLLVRGSGVLWSVPVELHFYVVFPVLWWAHSSGRFAPIAAALLVGCGALAWFVPHPAEVWILPHWLHYFVIGAALRWLLDDGTRSRLAWQPKGRAAVTASWTLFLLLPLLPLDLRVALGQPGTPPNLDPMSVLVVPVLLWLSCGLTGPFKLFAVPVLRWFGKISFGLYLIHMPVLAVILMARIGEGLPGPLRFAIVFTASTALAALLYRLFERPVQQAVRCRFDKPSIAAQP